MKEYQSLIGKIILGRCDHYSGLHRRQCNPRSRRQHRQSNCIGNF